MPATRFEISHIFLIKNEFQTCSRSTVGILECVFLCRGISEVGGAGDGGAARLGRHVNDYRAVQRLGDQLVPDGATLLVDQDENQDNHQDDHDGHTDCQDQEHQLFALV